MAPVTRGGLYQPPKALPLGGFPNRVRLRFGVNPVRLAWGARGLDGLWGMYQWLDRAPKGRNETALGGAATTSTSAEPTHHRSLHSGLLAIIEQAVRPERDLSPAELLAEVRRLGLRTPADSATIIRADRDRR
jgi:hypothetical protein